MDAYLSQVSIDQLALQAGPRKTVRSQGRRALESWPIYPSARPGFRWLRHSLLVPRCPRA
jgi:hypothetical protein